MISIYWFIIIKIKLNISLFYRYINKLIIKFIEILY